ncbi:MAG TPA: DUF2844 domain-containing protein [Terriglobia bacterium]|jgi:hypothetical protein|nr:DUF2844 domain-containing protein [Terriglobia bacterium]
MKTLWVTTLWVVLGSAPAWAVLGEYDSSIGIDQKVMRGEVRALTMQGYSVHEITGADRTVVREYVSPQGRVFGISWQGVAMPNLQQLLGSYFAQFQQASQSRKRRRGPLVVRTDQLVVESGGHMRSFHGRAYVPGLVPTNLSAEVVK